MTMVKIAASLREPASREAGVVRLQAGCPPPTATLSHNGSRLHLSNEGTGGRSSVDPESRSDEQLLTASATDPEAFVALYDRHAKRILAFFVRQTFDAQVAADLTAETFAQAFASRGRFRNPGPGSAESWLRTIARRQLNRFITRQRVERRWRERLGMEALAVSPDALERAEELIDLELVRREVAAALDGLRADEREALVLRVVEGKSYAVAAREAGCSEQALRARVSRGLRRLGGGLEGPGEDRHG